MHRFRSVDAAHLRRALFWSSSPLAALVLTAGCVANPRTAAESPSPSVLARPVASPSPAPSGLATPIASSNGAGPTPAVPPATIDVSPEQVQADEVMMSLAL